MERHSSPGCPTLRCSRGTRPSRDDAPAAATGSKHRGVCAHHRSGCLVRIVLSGPLQAAGAARRDLTMSHQRFALSILVLLHVLSGRTDAQAFAYAVPDKINDGWANRVARQDE